MAQLKDTIVSGNLRVTDTTLTDTLQVTTIKAPTSSGGTTYGPGTSGQVLKSNGTTTYWASDSNSDVNVTQTATTTDAAYEILFSGTADNTTRTETARKNSNLKFNPSTGSLYASFIYAGGSESQSAYPAGGYHVYDCRDIGVTPANGDKTANFYFHMTGTPDTSKWWSVMHVKGWVGAYSAWEIAGPAHNSDQRTTPLYVRTSNINSAWGSWRKIYDASNPPTASEVGALSTSTKYALSTSVGGNAILADGLAIKTLTAETLDTTTGSFVFKGDQLLGATYDWVGLQVDGSNDAFQLMANGQLMIRQNDTTSKTSVDWGEWKGCLLPSNVVGTSGITATQTDITIGSGETAFTYKGAVTISHSNSITEESSTVFKKFSYDANGHITGTANVAASDLPSHTHSQYYDSTQSRAANTVLAAPNGSNGAATFRKLVASDLPSHTHDSLYGVYSASEVPVTTLSDGQMKVFYNVNKSLTGNMPASNNANSIIQISKHPGNYDAQLGFSSDGNIYYRNCNNTPLSSSVSWKTILDSSNYTSYALSASTTYAGSSTVGGAANSAVKLETARTINVGTGVTGTATSFDGSANITIPVTGIKEAYLTWGGKDFTQSFSPLDAALEPRLGANRLEMCVGNSIKIERTTDGGTSWTEVTTSSINNANRSTLFSSSAGYSVPVSATSTAGMGDNAAKYMMRITLDTSVASVYTNLLKFIFNVSTNGCANCYVKLRIRTAANVTAGNDTWLTWDKTNKTWSSSPAEADTRCPIGGWSGYNVINFTSFTTYGNNTSQYRNIQFIFGCTKNDSTSAGLAVINIQGYGGVAWNAPSNMARTGHLYSWNGTGAAAFPSSVTANGNLIASSASGDSPALIFRRGTYVDNLNDWKIYVSSGHLYFDQSTANASSETWTHKMYYHASESNLYIGSSRVLHAGNYTSYTYSSTASRTANYVLAAPNGSAGAATFRKLVADDLPSHTHQYAGSASVGGPASLLAYGHTNEINISGGKQSTCYFNYRDADTDAQDEGETPVSINYKFCNYRNSTANTTITAANFSGNATSANTLTLKSLAFGSTLNTTTGLFAYTTTGSIYGTNAADWVGIQIGSNADRFQIMGSIGSTVLIRTNDNSDGTISTGWSKWAALMTPASVVAGSGLTKTYGYFDGTADSDIIINATIGHSNSVTAQSTTVFKKFSYDACGHITGVSAVAAADITALGIPAQDTTYSAGNHLSLSSTTFSLASYCKTITDWNDAKTTGWYMGASVTNAPSTAWWMGRVTAHNAKYCIQEVWQFTASTDGHKVPHKMRMYVNEVWGNWVDITVGTAVPENAVFTDTKVTSSTNHYTPATASGSDISKSASGATAAWSIDVVKGITLNTDGKGHVTGISVTSGKIPGNPVPSNNVTGSGTSGYLAKWNGTNTITQGPLIGTSTTTFLRNDGTWATPDNLASKALTAATFGSTSGNFFFKGDALFGGTDNADWVGIQGDASNDKFQLVAGGGNGVFFRESDDTWGEWHSLLTNNMISGSSGITVTQRTIKIGGDDGTTINAGVTISHTNSITPVPTNPGFYKFKFDAQGHITETAAVAKADITTLGIPGSDTKYGISGAYGSGNKTWVTTLTAGGTGTTSTVPTASTSVYGITKLYNGVDSTSTELAATANAVKTAYDKGNHSHPYLSNTTKYALSSSVGGPALTQLTEALSDTTSSHATVLQTYFTNNVSTVTRNQQLAFYSRAYSNGSMYMGYFLSSYDENPYGGFFVAHYNDPYYVGIKGGTFTQYPLLTQRTLTPETMDTVTGSFVFNGEQLLGDIYDWAGLQVDAGNDAFQMTINSTQLIIRQNDTSTKTTENWGSWRGCLTPANVSGSGGITVTENDTTIGSGASALTYKGSVTISHSNSITAQTSTVFKKFSYDAQGHITGVDTVAGTDLPAHTHTHSKGGTWIKARDNPNIYVNPPTNSGSYYPAIFAKTKDGGWSMGVLGGSSTENVLYVTYTTDANYNADNNTNTYQISFPKDGGTLALTKDYVAKSGDTMTGLLTMYREGTTAQDYPAGFKFSVKDTTTGKTYSDAYIYAYQDHAANSYGTNMVINPGGCIFIGAGESAGAHYSAIKSNLATSEYMYLTADTGIYIQGNGGTIANRKGLYIDTGHNIVPSVADTLTNNVGSIGTSDYRWANVYATQLNGKLGQYISTGRPTSANLTTVGDRTVQLIQATSSMTTAKPSTDGYILNFDWDNAGNYQSQLFLANNVGGLNHIQVRAQGGSATWENSKWVTLLSERNSPAFNRIFDRYYRTPASTGWVRILTIGSTNNNGRVYGMSKITISRTWSNNPPEIVSFEVIHNYNTSPNIYFSKSLQQTSSTKVFTNIRIVKSSDGKEQYVDIYHNVSSQNYISIRYEIFEPYDMLDVNNGFPITTPSDGTTLSVLSTTPASADIMRASVAIPSQYDNNFIYANSYWGFAHRDGTTTAYMRTTSNGLLPYQSGNVGSGHSNIGTSSWYFSNIYVDTVNSQQVKIKGTGTYNGTISNANATADRTVILPDSSGVIALMNVILDDAQGVTEWDFSLDANLYRSFIIEVIMPGYTTQTVTVVAHKYYPTAPSSFTMHSSKATSASSYNILPAWIGLCYNEVDTSTPTWQFSVGRASKAISLNSSGGIASVNVPNTDKIKMTKIIGLTN